MLPHRFPFALVEILAGDRVAPDRVAPDRVALSVSQGSWWGRSGSLSPFLALEAMAQGAALLLGETGEGGDAPAPVLYLAAIDSARFDPELATSPICAGDVLEVRARLRIKLGPLLRIEAELHRNGRSLIEAAFTASAPPATPSREAAR